jgi:transcriptional regulator with XRE-family HTH domain
VGVRGYPRGMGKREKEPHKGTRKTVGDNLSRLMTDKKITAKQIASGKLVDRRTIDRLRAGEIGPSIDTIGHIADALGAKPLDLFIERGPLTGKGDLSPTPGGQNLQGIALRNVKRKDKK